MAGQQEIGSVEFVARGVRLPGRTRMLTAAARVRLSRLQPFVFSGMTAEEHEGGIAVS